MKLFNQLWERALLYLEEDLNTFQFNVWIKELKPVREEGDNFYFEVSTLMQKNLMNEKYGDPLLCALFQGTSGSEQAHDAAGEQQDRDQAEGPGPEGGGEQDVQRVTVADE